MVVVAKMTDRHPTIPLTMSGFCAFPTDPKDHKCNWPGCTCQCHKEEGTG